MRNKTFPKEGEKKLKETIQKLKARNKYLEKKIKFYENKLLDHHGLPRTKLAKPDDLTPAKPTAINSEMKREKVRKRILKEFRESIKK